MTDHAAQDTSDRNLRVAFCPGSATNPYTSSLGGQMEQQGCTIAQAPLSTFFLYTSRACRQADVIHIHWPDAYMIAGSWWKTCAKSIVFLLQLLVKRLLGGRIVWTAHNLASHEGHHPCTQRMFTRCMVALCQRVLAHNEACGEVVANHFGIRPGKIRVVPHANYIEDYPQGIGRAEARQKLNLDESDFVFLFVGAIRGYKGVLELIDSFGQLEADNARLIVAGKSQTDQIDREVRQRADATPGVIYQNEFVPADQMQTYMAAADVIVLPYRKIFTSGALLLAASFGKVAIVPDARTLTAAVDPQGVIAFDPEDPHGLVDGMRAAIAERETLSARGAASRKHVEPWDWAEMAAATIKAYS